MLQVHLAQCAPTIGQPWKPDVRWIFNKARHISCTRKQEDCFINGIWCVWSKICEGLILKQLDFKEEVLPQPITWNPRQTLLSERMLGERSKIVWGPVAAEPNQSIKEWHNFVDHAGQEQGNFLRRSRGAYIMANEISMALHPFSFEGQMCLHQGCFGRFKE